MSSVRLSPIHELSIARICIEGHRRVPSPPCAFWVGEMAGGTSLLRDELRITVIFGTGNSRPSPPRAIEAACRALTHTLKTATISCVS